MNQCQLFMPSHDIAYHLCAKVATIDCEGWSASGNSATGWGGTYREMPSGILGLMKTDSVGDKTSCKEILETRRCDGDRGRVGGGGVLLVSDGGHDRPSILGESDQRDVAVVEAERGEDELAVEEMEDACWRPWPHPFSVKLYTGVGPSSSYMS